MLVLLGWNSAKNESSAWLVKRQGRKELRLLEQAWPVGLAGTV